VGGSCERDKAACAKKPRSGKTEAASAEVETMATAEKRAVPPKPAPIRQNSAGNKADNTAAGAALDARERRATFPRGGRRSMARLDLHGMTQTRRPPARCSGSCNAPTATGLTFVLVITGKGRGGS